MLRPASHPASRPRTGASLPRIRTSPGARPTLAGCLQFARSSHVIGMLSFLHGARADGHTRRLSRGAPFRPYRRQGPLAQAPRMPAARLPPCWSPRAARPRPTVRTPPHRPNRVSPPDRVPSHRRSDPLASRSPAAPQHGCPRAAPLGPRPRAPRPNAPPFAPRLAAPPSARSNRTSRGSPAGPRSAGPPVRPACPAARLCRAVHVPPDPRPTAAVPPLRRPSGGDGGLGERSSSTPGRGSAFRIRPARPLAASNRAHRRVIQAPTKVLPVQYAVTSVPRSWMAKPAGMSEIASLWWGQGDGPTMISCTVWDVASTPRYGWSGGLLAAAGRPCHRRRRRDRRPRRSKACTRRCRSTAEACRARWGCLQPSPHHEHVASVGLAWSLLSTGSTVTLEGWWGTSGVSGHADRKGIATTPPVHTDGARSGASAPYWPTIVSPRASDRRSLPPHRSATWAGLPGRRSSLRSPRRGGQDHRYIWRPLLGDVSTAQPRNRAWKPAPVMPVGDLRRCALAGGVRAEWVRASIQRRSRPVVST